MEFIWSKYLPVDTFSWKCWSRFWKDEGNFLRDDGRRTLCRDGRTFTRQEGMLKGKHQKSLKNWPISTRSVQSRFYRGRISPRLSTIFLRLMWWLTSNACVDAKTLWTEHDRQTRSFHGTVHKSTCQLTLVSGQSNTSPFSSNVSWCSITTNNN